MVFKGFKSGIFLLPNPSIVLAMPENSSSSEKSSLPEHWSDYLEYISPEEKILRKAFKLPTL